MENRKKYLMLCIFFFGFLVFAGGQEKNFALEREQMVVRQIENRGITHQATLDAMRTVPRHQFVPDYLMPNAYQDGPLPIGYGQTISQPYIVAYMTAILKPEKGNKILEIGTGSGYQAAVLSQIVDSVFTVEIVDELAKRVTKKFEMLGYRNIWVKSGDGFFGWEEHAPFDKIIVTAAAEEIPPLLLQQLKDGGRMILPIGPEFSVQYLILVEKKNGKVKTTNKMPVRFVPFTRNEE